MMEDIDRMQVNCWHGNKLYECEDPEHMTPVTTVTRTDYEPVPKTYYRGRATLATRITDRESEMFGGDRVTYLKCEHMHTDWEAAEKCGARLAKRKARELNRENGVTK